LVHLEGSATSLQGQWRAHAPLRPGRNVEALAEDIKRLVREAAAKLSELSARLRQAGNLSAKVSSVAVFMSPPWGRPNLDLGQPEFVPHMQEALVHELSPYFEVPPQFYTGAGAGVQGLRAMAPFEDKFLLCIVTHETTELLLVSNGAVAGHATIPHGMNLPLRTLRAHGGLSDAEARSALLLQHPHEPLAAAGEQWAQEFLGAGRELFDAWAPQRVWVVSPAGEYFARILSSEQLASLFPQGGVVRTLLPHHARDLIHSPGQDIFLILQALYVQYI